MYKKIYAITVIAAIIVAPGYAIEISKDYNMFTISTKKYEDYIKFNEYNMVYNNHLQQQIQAIARGTSILKRQGANPETFQKERRALFETSKQEQKNLIKDVMQKLGYL
ncbi:MAG TPA: hypothetical protein VLB80_03075 [Candidatus Babeliales bacterium]|nr:hypothetical protein [Candidatus Babeliales bacterium]